MFTVVDEHVFPFLRTLGGDGSAFAQHMKDARFSIPTPALLAKVVDKLDACRWRIATPRAMSTSTCSARSPRAGQNGQFRTPRHIIALMVEMTAPTPKDIICDPACGTCGFLVAAGEYLRERHPEVLRDPKLRKHFHENMFHGFDFDSTMLRIGSMNMMLHGVENPRHRVSGLAGGGSQRRCGDATRWCSPIRRSPDRSITRTTAKDLQQIVKTKKTELLFLALFLRLLKPGGRAAVIVPDGVLFGSSNAHKELRRMLVEDHKLDAVIKLPSGVFRPYAGVSTAILVFTKTDVGGTDHVWFYDMEADGWSLDDKRQPLLPEKARSDAQADLTADEHAKNNLPDVLARWEERDGAERERPRTAQSFCVPKAEIAASGSYDLSLNRYKEVEHEEEEHASPAAIVRELRALEEEISEGLSTLEEMLA